MRDRITDSFEVLADYLGHEAALRLTEVFGGSDIMVPKREAGRTWNSLVAALGETDAGASATSSRGNGSTSRSTRRAR